MGSKEVKIAKAVCCMCHARCRVDVHSREGQLIKIEPDMALGYLQGRETGPRGEAMPED